jgi:hypothetical protein
MTLRLPIIIIIFFCIPCIAHSQKQESVKIRPIGELTNVQLEKDYAYYFFEANQDYLVWYEGYTSMLFIYDIGASRVNKIALSKGRGPNEFKKISGISILSDNIVYLSDHTNAKFIRIKASGEFMEDAVPPNGLQPMTMVSDERYQVIMEAFSREAIFYLKEQDKENFHPLKLNGTEVIEEFPSIFQREGYLTIQNAYLIHLTKYYPYIYVYDLANIEMEKKIKFDESEVEEGRTMTNKEGTSMMYPPEKVGILNEDVSFIPGSANRIFLLARGKSENRNYDLDKLYEYDFEKEKFITEYDLGINATEITINDKYLFVYSEDDYKIYQYEILPYK